jgi:hypothetical protein
MALPLYVLLPDGVEWTEVPGTVAQTPRPVRWYLRQHMVGAATQVGVLVSGDDEQAQARCIAEVAARAKQLGGMVVDAGTQEPVEPTAPVTN